MPNIVKTDIGEIRFSDEYSPEQIEGILRTQLPSWRERISKGWASDLASRLPRDVAQAGADTIMGAARGRQMQRDTSVVANLRSLGMAAAMTSPVGEEHAVISAANKVADDTSAKQEATREQRLAQDPVYKFGEQSKKNAQEFYQTNPTRDNSILAMGSQAAGSTIPVMASAAFGPAAPLVGALVYGAQSGQQGAQEAIQMGHPEKADEAYLAYAGLGVISEALLGYPVALLKKVAAARKAGVDPVAFGQSVKTSLSEIGKKIGKEMAEGTAREGAQEGTEQLGQNVAAKMIGFDPDRPLTKDVVQSMLVGGAVGGLFGGVGGGAMAIDEARARAAVPAMLKPDTELVNVPGETQPGVVSAPQPLPATQPSAPPPAVTPPQAAAIPALLSPNQLTAEQIAAEEAAAVAAIRARQQRVDPYFADEAAQEPVPAQPTPAPKRRSPIVPESERPYFRPPPANPVTQVPENAQLGYTPNLPGPPEATVAENATVQPEAQTKGEIPNETQERRKEELLVQSTGGQVPPVASVQIQAQQKGVATVSPPDTSDAAYNAAQANIEAIEDRLTTQGVNVLHLYDQNDPATKNLAGYEDWKPMPKDLADAYSARDKIGAVQMDQSVTDLKQRLSRIGLNEGEANRVLDYYGINPTARDAAAQNLATEHAPKLAKQKPETQAAGLASAISAQRNELTDELKDVSRKSLIDAAKAVQVVREYFGLSTTQQQEPNATITGEEKSIQERSNAGGRLEINGQDRNIAPPEQAVSDQTSGGNQLLGTQTETPQAQGTVGFQDWRIQGNIIRNSGVGKKLTQAEANSIRDTLAEYGVGARFDSTKGTVVIKSGLMSDVTRAWEERGSYAKGQTKLKTAKQARQSEAAQTEAERNSELATMPSVKWIDETFGADAMNSVNKLALARYLEGTAAKFTGLSNPKWKPGLAKISATTIPDVKVAFEASRATQQVKDQVQEVAQVEGQRAAKEVKSELVSRLEQALVDAPPASDFAETSHTLTNGKRIVTPAEKQPEKITIEIPGDGTFTIVKTKEAIEEILKRARKIATASTQAPSVTQRKVTGEQGKQFAEEAQMSPEEIAAYRASQPSSEKFSVTLSDPSPTSGLTQQDIERAFPSRQGFDVKPVAIDWIEKQPSIGFLVQLPNGQIIVIDPTHDKLAFDPKKAAKDWGLDPATVAQYGIARGKWTPGGVKIEGLDVAGIMDLLNTSGPDTLSHEKFHPLFQLALNESERQDILKRYGTEEKAAEAFRRSEGFTRSFWEKMKRFLEWLANLVRGDAFKKLRAPLDPNFRSEPKNGGEKMALDLSSRKAVEDLTSKPFISTEEAASLERQAGVGARLVPDAIASEVRSLDATDPIEKRMAGELAFVLKLHGSAQAVELQKMLADPNIPEDQKHAAISNVLRQIEHVRVKTSEYEEKLQEANANLARIVKNGTKITAQKLVEDQSKTIANNLISRYQQYLTAQAANLPSNQNLAARRAEMIRELRASVAQEEKYLDQTQRAMEAIAERIDELPVSEGPQAVINAIRSKGILKGKVSDTLIDLLTAENGGFQPLLLNPTANQMLMDLSDLQKKSETYAKQIAVIEQAFRGTGDPTPVEVKKFAEAYRTFRNKQKEAAKAVAEMDQQFREADADVQVYGRSHDLLTRLQNSPQFRQQFESAINRPGGSLFNDITKADKETGELTYISPKKQENEEGKEFQNEFKVSLRPDRKADKQTVTNMANLVLEIEEFLAGENVDPLEARTWRERMEYLNTYMLNPKFQSGRIGGEIETTYGTIRLNLWEGIKLIWGGSASAPRSELERTAYRATRSLNNSFVAGDLAGKDYKRHGNDLSYGDEVTKQAVLAALKSHKWDVEKRMDWNRQVLNPIIASGQNVGQMRLKAGDYIPGTGIQITEEDMAVAKMEKRYSQAIVNVTQGTAKGSTTLLQQNPILVEDTQGFAGRKIKRGALSPGPLTMARRFSDWGKNFTNWWKGISDENGNRVPAPSYSEKRQHIQDGLDFEGVLRHVTTTNPEFESQSPNKPLYEEFAARAKTLEDYQVRSLDQLIDRLATIAMSKGMYESEVEAKLKIEENLISELDAMTDAFFTQVMETEQKKPTETSVESVRSFASANNPFTKARVRMVASDPFYDYTLTTDSDRIGFVSSGYQMFQLNQITEMEKLVQSLDQIQSGMDAEIKRLQSTGLSQRKATAVVQNRTKLRLNDTKFSYVRLVAFKHTMDKILKSLSELVIDQRDRNDAIALYALSRFRSTISSALLSNAQAISNNVLSGIFPAQYLTLQNLGRANIFITPVVSTKNTVKYAVNQLLSAYPARTAIGAFARSNIPLIQDMAQYVDSNIRDWVQMKAEMAEAGLTSRADLKNRLRNMRDLKRTAGRLEEQDPGMITSGFNMVETLPGVRQFLGHLRDKSPRLGDEAVNLITAEGQRPAIFDWLRLRAQQLFSARDEQAARTGAKDLNDFRSEANLVTPGEMQMGKSSGYRDLDRLRVMFDPIGSLDNLLLDYYTRWKAAPESEKADVPLFTNPADKGAILYNLGAHANIATAGFTPPAMQGVGQRGLIKSLFFMFSNYPRRMSEQMAKMFDYDPRDPLARRHAYLAWSTFAILVVSILAGMAAGEVAAPINQALTGRTPARITLGNVADNPDAAMLARYVGTALGNNIPYYGGVISRMLGNPGYGSWWDAADMVPMFGLVRDLSNAAAKMKQTQDPVFPAIDFIGRWFPPASPILRLLPEMQGDIAAKNAARALRVVGPSEGIELAGGGGGQTTQTPASAAIRRLISAAYRGDAGGIQKAFDSAVAEKAAQGNPDPEKAVLASLASKEPARAVYGRAITSAEEARLIGRMSGAQRVSYQNSRDAFSLINQTLGTKLSLTTEPKARTTTRGQASRRTLFSAATPMFGATSSRSRRRSLGGRRRSAFSRLQIRGASRRKRRSPARFSFA